MEASSYAGEIQAAFHGFDTDRFLKTSIAELVCGNENVYREDDTKR